MGSLRPASEDHVVLAFLQGELESPRSGGAVRAALARLGGVELITDPNLASGEENEARRSALAAVRGWSRDEGILAGFPEDVAWSHGLLDVGHLDRIRFLNFSYWTALSGGSRRPADVPGLLDGDRLPGWLRALGTEWCLDLAGRVAVRGLPGSLILVGTPDLSDLVVVEGHARLTALYVGGLHNLVPVPAYVGTSERIRDWPLF